MGETHTLRCDLMPTCGHPMTEVCVTPEQLRLAEAVIEAAKAAKESLYWAENAGLYWPRPGLLELRQAVEALIAAEKEGE